MSIPDKWKRGFRKVIEQQQHQRPMSRSGSILEEETTDQDVDMYLDKLKKKTNLKYLWSGKRFDNFVDGDRTPDISIDSDDDDLNMKIKDFQNLSLDSDEDEMRINYMREANLTKIDENNNEEESDDDRSFNLMNNIHFAELEVAEFELSDTEVHNDKVDDFLPKVYSANFKDDSDSESTFQLGKNIHVMKTSSISELSDESRKNTLNNSLTKDNSKIVHSESIHTEEMSSMHSLNSRHSSNSRNSSNSSNSKHSITSKHSTQSKDDYTQSDFESDLSSTHRLKTRTHSKTSRITTSRNSKHSKNNKLRDTSGSESTLSSTSSISTDASSYKASRKSKSHRSSKHKQSNKKQQINSDSQTQINYKDMTNDVLNFKYCWQNKEPSSIAKHVIDPMAIDVLTNYNPAVLAANDMMKFHLSLMKGHIENSRRLYEAYANDGINKNYKYTTVGDTMKYIKKNCPKVISYEQALKEIKDGSI